ncbi:nuclear transport factor 2 family protein [Mucilaginibacter sp. P25]|uniref:DUF4440 domain-containing protein n=1 Tax=Mucilaginibacter gossypii TaxID=551996 RepID=A0A1G7U884_9SPHI|nr:nuclear transport factor 2 family protein [Mucilaginibacter gossypii]SDG43786.1 protein of unknown function [Mucilaginibacter gossypii]
MKPLILILLIIVSLDCSAQTAQEKNLLSLSDRIFEWEVAGKIDSLEQIFHKKFQVVGSSGEAQSKAAYIARLQSGNFVHNAIIVDESVVAITDNTGAVFGKGTFTVTSNGHKVVLKLSYIEVFTRTGKSHPWKLLAMHASSLPEKR